MYEENGHHQEYHAETDDIAVLGWNHLSIKGNISGLNHSKFMRLRSNSFV